MMIFKITLSMSFFLVSDGLDWYQILLLEDSKFWLTCLLSFILLPAKPLKLGYLVLTGCWPNRNF